MGKFQNMLVLNKSTARKVIGKNIEKLKVLDHILKCHTEAMGMNDVVCEECDYHEVHYNSCRDRNCPECQYGKCQEWVDTYTPYILDGIEYFHVVFTLPNKLNSLIYLNQKKLYGLMFKAASSAVIKASKNKYGKPGFTLILHTWGSNMYYHPHLHCIVAGGGITTDEKGNEFFKKAPKNFFLPVKVLSKLFKSIFLKKLGKMHKDLAFVSNNRSSESYYEDLESDVNDLQSQAVFENFISDLYQKEWVVFSKSTFENANAVVNYIGRYTHRIAISNSRIVKFDDKKITFMCKDYKNNGNKKEMEPTSLNLSEDFSCMFFHPGLLKSDTMAL